MTRLFIRTFLFKSRDPESRAHAHDAGPAMTVPLLILAVLAAISGFVVFSGVGEAMGFPGGFGEFVFLEHAEEFEFNWDIVILSTVLGAGGMMVGYVFWANDAVPATRMGELFRPVYNVLYNRFYIDDIYQFVIDRVILAGSSIVSWFDRNIVNDTGVDGSAGLALLAGWQLKFTSTGKLPNYALAISAGVIILALVFLIVKA
jgi:NADH-quinone oxidoreductase subunit L